jgi:hypothetical protein
MKPVLSPRLIFAFFASAILFSMVREWNGPAACAPTTLVSSHYGWAVVLANHSSNHSRERWK